MPAVGSPAGRGRAVTVALRQRRVGTPTNAIRQRRSVYGVCLRLDCEAKRRLAVVRHVEEVSGLVIPPPDPAPIDTFAVGLAHFQTGRPSADAILYKIDEDRAMASRLRPRRSSDTTPDSASVPEELSCRSRFAGMGNLVLEATFPV